MSDLLNPNHFHPLVVHFPIVLIMIGFLAQFFSLIFKNQAWLSKAAMWLIFLGALAAIAGYFTGEYLTKDFTGEAGELKERHEIFAKASMWLMIAAGIIRLFMILVKKELPALNWLIFIIVLAAATTVGITGFLGGSLVYNFMVGI